MKLMIWLMGAVGATIAGWIGWELVAILFPEAIATAFIVSTIASGFGMYYGAKWAKHTFGF